MNDPQSVSKNPLPPMMPMIVPIVSRPVGRTGFENHQRELINIKTPVASTSAMSASHNRGR